MYEQGTVLELKEPRKIEDKAGNEIDFPYNRVLVLGSSPINHGVHVGEWSGAAGQGVIIQPLSGFDANLDEPFGKLTALYKIVEEPVHEAPAVPVRVINRTSKAAGLTPEEVFAMEAPGEASTDGKPVRRLKNESPLEDPRPQAGESPLDEKPRRTRRNG
jgi:hypothetical protein